MYSNHGIARLKFILTENCNFRCAYCFEGEKKKSTLDSYFALQTGIDVLSTMKQDWLKVLYFGGEPLLRFQDMKILTELLDIKAKRLSKHLHYTIITNGSIMTPHILSHLKRYRYYCSVSFDGITNHHRRWVNGKSPDNEVLGTLKLLAKETPDFNVSMVVTNQNVSGLSESVDFLLTLGIRNFAVSPVLNDAAYTPDPVAYEEQLLKVVDLLTPICNNERVVFNPPLDNGWDENAATRSMSLTANSVNIEVFPNEVRIVPERQVTSYLPYGAVGPSLETRKAIIAAENSAALAYRKVKERQDK